VYKYGKYLAQSWLEPIGLHSLTFTSPFNSNERTIPRWTGHHKSSVIDLHIYKLNNSVASFNNFLGCSKVKLYINSTTHNVNEPYLFTKFKPPVMPTPLLPNDQMPYWPTQQKSCSTPLHATSRWPGVCANRSSAISLQVCL
jgi:hypothetical protein